MRLFQSSRERNNMNDLDLLFTRSISFNSLPDSFTQNAVKEYVLHHSDYKNPKLCLQYLCKAYPFERSLRDLSAQFLISVESSWNVRGLRKLFLSFLIFCSESSYINDSRINRLIDFKASLNAITVNDTNIHYLLEDNDYDEFKNSALFSQLNEKNVVTVYVHSIPSKIAKSGPYATSLNAYLKELKYREGLIPAIKMVMLARFDDICKNLSDEPLMWTATDIIEIIEKAKKLSSTQYSTTMMVLIGILSHLCKDQLINDKQIKKLVELNNTRTTNINVDQILEILSFPHPECWAICSFSHPNGRKHNNIRYIDCTIKEIRKIIIDFISNYCQRADSGISEFCRYFSQSLEGYKLLSVSDFCFSSFQTQVMYFYRLNDKKRQALGTLVAFYVYLSQTHNDQLFESEWIPTTILQRQYIGSEIATGYKIIKYNQLENVPDSDKWLLCYKKYDRDTLVQTARIDFTCIESSTYRSWYKHYLWKEDVVMYTKLHPLPILAYGFNYLHGIKCGKVLSVFSKPGTDEIITTGDITAYRNHVLEVKSNNRTRSGYIYNMRNMLRHVDTHHLGTIDPGVFYTLTHTLDQSYDNTLPVPNKDLAAIATLLKQKSEEDIFASVCSSIFFIALETEFRGSQIVNLNKDCLRPTAKNGEFVVVSETKTSANELVEQPVSTYVEREIRHVVAATEEYRHNCTNVHLLNKLFICPGNKKGTYRKITESRFNDFLKGCCKELEIPLYTLENLRDTHMTKAEEYKIRNQLSDVEQRILTGHVTTAVDDIHYVKLDIREMLEAIHGVIIGDVLLDGKIYPTLDSSIANASNEVENGCGYCNSPSCNMLINLDCVLCKNFVTTISRLPYFEEQVHFLDKKIEKATIPHDKEDFVNVKRLMLRYIEEILKLKETLENGG